MVLLGDSPQLANSWGGRLRHFSDEAITIGCPEQLRSVSQADGKMSATGGTLLSPVGVLRVPGACTCKQQPRCDLRHKHRPLQMTQPPSSAPPAAAAGRLLKHQLAEATAPYAAKASPASH
jgi:hypothetical protein